MTAPEQVRYDAREGLAEIQARVRDMREGSGDSLSEGERRGLAHIERDITHVKETITDNSPP